MFHWQQTNQPDFLPLWLAVLFSIQWFFRWLTWKQTWTLKTFRLFFNRNWSWFWFVCVLLTPQFWELWSDCFCTGSWRGMMFVEQEAGIQRTNTTDKFQIKAELRLYEVSNAVSHFLRWEGSIAPDSASISSSGWDTSTVCRGFCNLWQQL